MRLLDDYQLYLFDFDGLLVNTEEIHYEAYKEMLSRRNYTMPWDFERYCQAAHYRAEALKELIYEEFPGLYQEEPDWKVLYAEKRNAMLELLHKGAVKFMPGAESFLQTLERRGVKRCVVTHSPSVLVETIRQHLPVLNTIPLWITREHYKNPKPDPECYFKAMEMYSEGDDRVIGFEDTPRGMTALMQSPAQSVIVTAIRYPEIPYFINNGAKHFRSFEEILDQGNIDK